MGCESTRVLEVKAKVFILVHEFIPTASLVSAFIRAFFMILMIPHFVLFSFRFRLR
jgi:hypothetical protein